MSDIREVKSTREAERREEYAKLLESVADQVRESDDLPAGVFVITYWQTGDLTKVYQCEPGFNALSLIGIFESLKQKLVLGILGAF